jgi:hypothetical protein
MKAFAIAITAGVLHEQKWQGGEIPRWSRTKRTGALLSRLTSAKRSLSGTAKVGNGLLRSSISILRASEPVEVGRQPDHGHRIVVIVRRSRRQLRNHEQRAPIRHLSHCDIRRAGQFDVLVVGQHHRRTVGRCNHHAVGVLGLSI